MLFSFLPHHSHSHSHYEPYGYSHSHGIPMGFPFLWDFPLPCTPLVASSGLTTRGLAKFCNTPCPPFPASCLRDCCEAQSKLNLEHFSSKICRLVISVILLSVRSCSPIFSAWRWAPSLSGFLEAQGPGQARGPG